MIERVVDYLANAVWQLPLLALGAWWLLRSARLGPKAQHGVWIAVLGLGVALPLARVAPVTVRPAREIAVRPVVDAPVLMYIPEHGALRPAAAREPVKASGSRLGWMGVLLQRRSLRVSAGVAKAVAVFSLATMLMGLLRIVLAWAAARRVVRESQEILLSDHAQQLLDECGQKLGIVRPVVAQSAAVQSPAIVGVVAPILLVPEGFAGYADDDLRAVLLHEMAHIRRRDYGANLLCEMAALPVVWHPVAHVVRRRIRSTREMVCDGIAADAMGSAYAYALSLLELAKACMDVGAQPMAVGLFTNNNLEERVMQLIQKKQTMGVRTSAVRLMSAAAGMVAVVALAGMVHVTPAMAQTAEPAPSVASQQPPSTSEPQAAPATTGAPAAGVDSDKNKPATGVSAPPVDEELTVPVQDDKSMDEPLAMAHGDGVSVEPREGEYVHRWTAADGKPFEVRTREAAEPTPEEKKRYEEQSKKWAADLRLLQVEDLKLDNVKELKDLVDVKLKKQLAKLQSPEFQMQMKLQTDALQQNLGDLKINDAELQKQLGKLNSEDMQKQMAEMQKEIAESGIQSADAQKQMEKLDSVEMKKQMADMDRQLAALTRQEIRSQVKDEVQKQVQEQLKEAQKHLDEARKEIEKAHARSTEHTAAPCTEPCSAQPQ